MKTVYNGYVLENVLVMTEREILTQLINTQQLVTVLYENNQHEYWTGIDTELRLDPDTVSSTLSAHESLQTEIPYCTVF
jgi:hypothetical protein